MRPSKQQSLTPATAISVAVAAGIDPLAPQTLAVVLPAVLALVGGRWAGWDISSQWDCTKCNGSQKQPDAASFVLPVSFFGAARAFDVTSCPLVNEARSSMKACCGEAWPLRRTSAARPVAVIGLNASVLGVVPFGPDVVVRAPHACTVAAMISQRDGHVVCWKWWSESWWGVDSDATRAVRGAPPWGENVGHAGGPRQMTLLQHRQQRPSRPSTRQQSWSAKHPSASSHQVAASSAAMQRTAQSVLSCLAVCRQLSLKLLCRRLMEPRTARTNP